MKYTAEEVRAHASMLRECRINTETTRDRQQDKLADICDAYADLLERIKADEGAVPVAKIRHFHYSGIARNGFSQEAQMLDGAPELPDGTELFTHPPAQAAQVDLRNSLLRGKAQNEEPRVRHSCNMGVGCEETGICYAEANGQPKQCGRPTAQPPGVNGAVLELAWSVLISNCQGENDFPSDQDLLAAIKGATQESTT